MTHAHAHAHTHTHISYSYRCLHLRATSGYYYYCLLSYCLLSYCLLYRQEATQQKRRYKAGFKIEMFAFSLGISVHVHFVFVRVSMERVGRGRKEQEVGIYNLCQMPGVGSNQQSNRSTKIGRIAYN